MEESITTDMAEPVGADMPRLRVTFLGHSAFLLAYDTAAFVFDYAGDASALTERLAEFAQVYVFASHGHGDHYTRGVFDWRGHPSITYVLSYDITDALSPLDGEAYRVAVVSPGMTKEFDRATVRAYESTDLGVSFLVKIMGAELNVFHAGDLNLWHWRGESTPREIEAAEEAFDRAIQPIIGEPIDVCMFPVDPRLGAMHDLGADIFISKLRPRVFIPMHFWGRGDVAAEFARKTMPRGTVVVPLTAAGEEFIL
ncbi:MAG: MBL fold metallo-hydrolase [Oscillospiraceae bacterium]|jgi:L-ascorbate metabolism protein UlaG (beta-lactamase superfamily)|nr:MBL fold metallo-hydrolase [Oscillospiraceae bacterium]